MVWYGMVWYIKTQYGIVWCALICTQNKASDILLMQFHVTDFMYMRWFQNKLDS